MQNTLTIDKLNSIVKVNGEEPSKYESEVRILACILDENHDIESIEESTLFEALQDLQSNDLSDYQGFEFDDNEYRIIAESDIWEIYKDTIKELVEDCHSDVIKLDEIPSFIAVSIDWEQTAQNAYSDGYGHTFSSYDGSELEIANHFIFRTN